MDRRHFLVKRLRDFELAERRSKLDHSTYFRTAILIADKHIEFVTASNELTERLRTYFSEYLDYSNSIPCSEIIVEPLSSPKSLPYLWEDADAEFDVRGDMVIHRDFAAKRLDPISSQTQKTVAWVSSELDDAFHNMLRWHIPSLLLKDNAFLMHSAGVIREGFGYIFFGQSGAGKSTCANLIKSADSNAQLIGDDAVIIQIDKNGNPVVHSAPLGCGYTRLAPPKLKAPLAGIFSIRQSSVDSIEKLTYSQGIASLLSSAMVTTWNEFVDDRFELAKRFAQSAVGIKALHFTKQKSFWELILKGPLS